MKVYNYTIITLGMLLLLEFAGINTNTNLLSIVGIGTDSFGFSLSNFYGFLFGSGGILLGVGTATVVVGLFTKASPENLILLPFITGVLAVFIQGMGSIIIHSLGNYSPWVSAIILLLLAPYVVGYALSLAEFFRGTD